MGSWFQEMDVKCNSVSYLQNQEGRVRMQAAIDTGACEKELAYKMHWEKWTEANIGTVSQLELVAYNRPTFGNEKREDKKKKHSNTTVLLDLFLILKVSFTPTNLHFIKSQTPAFIERNVQFCLFIVVLRLQSFGLEKMSQ